LLYDISLLGNRVTGRIHNGIASQAIIREHTLFLLIHKAYLLYLAKLTLLPEWK